MNTCPSQVIPRRQPPAATSDASQAPGNACSLARLATFDPGQELTAT